MELPIQSNLMISSSSSARRSQSLQGDVGICGLQETRLKGTGELVLDLPPPAQAARAAKGPGSWSGQGEVSGSMGWACC